MHDIEPYYHWRHLYTAEADPRSIFFGRAYSEFEFSQTVYNYYIHPQWDEFGSKTLYLKILYADYDAKFAIIEFIGEWNDTIENDIMELKREVFDKLMAEGIIKFILIAEMYSISIVEIKIITRSSMKNYRTRTDGLYWSILIRLPNMIFYCEN